MKFFKMTNKIIASSLLMFALSCDDRYPSEAAAVLETGSLELYHAFIHGPASNPIIVGELISDPDYATKIVVVARLLDSEGNGVNNKTLQFVADPDLTGNFDTSDPSTKYVPNFKQFGFSEDVGGNSYRCFRKN